VHNKGYYRNLNSYMAPEDGGSNGVRTLVVGIDAASEEVLQPLFERGEVPALRELFDQGASGALASTVPPWTPSAWPSMYTGTNPGKHGVFGFLAYDGYEWDVVDATHVRERPLWNVLDRHGLASVVVNAPVTHPPKPFDGALLPGYVAPEDAAGHPASVVDDVREALGGYRIYPPADPDLDDYRALVRSRGEAFRWLVDRVEPAFGFLQFQATDTVVHDTGGDREALAAVYRAVDRQVEAVLETCDPDATVVVSDHGIGPYGGDEFRVNEFLRDRGFVESRRGGEGMPSWAGIRESELAERADGTTEWLQRALSALSTVGLTAQRIERVLSTVGLAETVAELVPTDAARAAAEQVDFAASQAYMRSRIECGVRINLEGREPDGVVPQSEYETVREELIDALSGVRTPDGEPVFADVAPREAYFHGPEADRAVDVVTVPADYDQFLSASLAGDWFGEPDEPWNHKSEGVFAARGSGIDEGAAVDGATLVDVAPTVLATLDIPVDERMDGDVLPVATPAGEEVYPEYDPGEPAGTDDAAVERRLSNLGYLEQP